MPNPTGWVDPFGLSCKEGQLEIIRYQEGNQPHFVVKVTRGDEIQITEMETSGMSGTDTKFAEGDFSASLGMVPEQVIKVDIPDAEAALKFQKTNIGKNTGPYCTETNSCLTHVYDVMKAGGAEGVPSNSKTRTSMKYLMSLAK